MPPSTLPSVPSAHLLKTARQYRFLYPNSSDIDPAMQNSTPVNPFRINTCKSVSKQRTLTTFRINTYEKQGEGAKAQGVWGRDPPFSVLGACPDPVGVSQGQIHSLQAFGASLFSFSTPHPLFSATCSLFLQNTGSGGIPNATKGHAGGGHDETRTSFCNFGDEDGVRLHGQSAACGSWPAKRHAATTHGLRRRFFAGRASGSRKAGG
jgi:hypothetical protein